MPYDAVLYDFDGTLVHSLDIVVAASNRVLERRGLPTRPGPEIIAAMVHPTAPRMGLHAGMDSVFGLHHVAHAHNAEVGVDSLAGHDARSMRDAQAPSP